MFSRIKTDINGYTFLIFRGIIIRKLGVIVISKKPIGCCHICGSYGKLSYEHIPPEDALNSNSAIVYTGDNALKRYTGEKAKYINRQQGMGKYSLCESCNNNTGSWYAKSYSNVAKDVAHYLYANGDLSHGDILSFQFKELPALAFIKQIVVMFCSILPLNEVRRLGFDKFIMDKHSNEIDTTLFDIRMYLTRKNSGYLMVGPCSMVTITEDYKSEIVSAADLSAYPFGFILNLTPESPILYGTSLKKLFETDYDKKYNFRLPLMCLERSNPEFPIPLTFKELPQPTPNTN